jgi:hypothetical protein
MMQQYQIGTLHKQLKTVAESSTLLYEKIKKEE